MLKIGWATRDFTPDRPAMIQGQRGRRIGREAMDPLTLTALAVEGDEPTDAAIIISCDMPFTSPALWQDVRERLAESLPAFDGRKLVMNATHTHDAPVIGDGFYDEPGGEVMSPTECRHLLADRAAEAATEAWKSREDHLVGRAFGHAVLGHNRLAVYADGHAEMYGKTRREDFSHIAGYEDHSLDMLFTWKRDGSLSGIAAAIPCPSQVTENLHVFSADYWHEVRIELRKRLGADLFVLPICAPAGDQSPHFLLYGEQEAEMRERRGLSERQEIAIRVADAVDRALACTEAPTPGPVPFRHLVKELNLPPRTITKAERDWAQEQYEEWVREKGETTSWSPKRRLEVVEMFDGKREPEPFPVELHVMRIGDVALATNPFELFIDYGLRIKARSPAPQTILVQLAGLGWYLPTQRAIDGGGYGATPEVSLVGPEGGQMLVEETLRMINGLWD